MNKRTLQEYKEEVFDRLDDKTKLEFMYEMSKQLCEIEEYIEQLPFNDLVPLEVKVIHKILEGGSNE